MSRFREIMLTFVCVAVLCAAAQAGVSTTGSVSQETSIQSSYAAGARENSSSIIWFQEQDQITLSSSLALDISSPGTLDGTNSTLSPKTISTGTNKISVYMVHFDQVGTGGLTLSGTLTITGGDFIVGVISTKNSLSASDSSVGSSSVSTWDTNKYRGLDFGSAFVNYDTFNLSADRKTLTFSLYVAGAIDEFRIVTAPEPTTFALFGIGLLGFAYVAGRRRFQARKGSR